jgi:hypothetical protein
MPQSRLQKNRFRIGWDGLGQFQPLNVHLLFPRVSFVTDGRSKPFRAQAGVEVAFENALQGEGR